MHSLRSHALSTQNRADSQCSTSARQLGPILLFLGRFPDVQDLAAFPPLYVWGPVLLFGALLFVLQWGINRIPDRWYLMGYAGMVMAAFLAVAVDRTALWNRMFSSFSP